MKTQINFEIEDSILKEVDIVLDDIGLDLDSFIKMSLRKLIKEKSIGFIVNNKSRVQKDENEGVKTFHFKAGEDSEDFGNIVNDFVANIFDSIRMTKNSAIRLFRGSGVEIYSKNITFASKNSAANHYWSTPTIDVVEDDWYLILNDLIKRRLFLFYIPNGSITIDKLVKRADNPDLIDLQIDYSDETFTDKRSSISFEKYLIKTIKY